MNFSKYTTSVIIVFVALVSFGLGLWTGATQQNAQKLAGEFLNASAPEAAGGLNFNLFWEVWEKVKEDAVNQDVSDEDLFYGAVRGIVGALEDPYSIFLTPDETKKFNADLSGSFEGIGAEIGFNKNSILSIIAPLAGTPADRAGLKAGDMILKINGEDTTGMGIDEAVDAIRGKKGTSVLLNIFRDGEKEPKEYAIVRDTIKIESVKWEMKKAGDKNIAYIHLTHFNADTADKVDEIILPIMEKSPDGIILDLRNNPGGFLDGAVRIASHWTGEEVVVVEREKEDKRTELRGQGIAQFKDIPTVALVNGGSASASEIVAGALQDHKKAAVIGTQTFGKGSVQELLPLSNGSTVKITVAKWFTPNGTSISDKGITPDTVIEETAADADANKDVQLEKALETLQ